MLHIIDMIGFISNSDLLSFGISMNYYTAFANLVAKLQILIFSCGGRICELKKLEY